MRIFLSFASEQGRDAEAIYRGLLATPPEDDRAVARLADIALRLATIEQSSDRHDDAVRSSLKAIELLESIKEPDDPALEGPLSSTVWALLSGERFDEAVPYARRLHELTKRIHGPDSSRTTSTLSSPRSLRRVERLSVIWGFHSPEKIEGLLGASNEASFR